MRYDDASQADAHGHSDTIARPDVDRLDPGSYGPATGNAITGEGTSSGASGTDSAGSGHATIVAVAGAGGQAALENGAYQAIGQYGALSIDAQGNFSYERNPGTPDGVKDVFDYTIADASGASSSTTLTIDIAQVAAAAAGQSVVSLPPGVELSDIHVNGRDLIVDMPDGTQMVIPNGAVFVPQITIGDVEVPATNVAALLVQSEPEPAAGPPPSSGGNWNDAVPDLAPGAPVGDLVPPTELGYAPPTFEQPAQGIDTEPTLVIETADNPVGALDAYESVDEKGLPARNGNLPNEPAGSGEIADGNGANDSDPSEANTGTIVFTAQDGLEGVTVNGVAVTAVGQQIAGQYGTMTITGVDLASGRITYSYALADNTSGDATKDVFTVVIADHDGDSATGTLTVNIADDHPTALDDADTVDAVSHVATGNVITGAGTTSGASGADTVGADNAAITSVSSNATGNSDSSFESGALVVKGEYGTLTIHADGSYSYAPSGSAPGGSTDVFTYTLTDGDGDPETATLTITNPDHTPAVGSNAAVQLDDDALAGGNPGGTGDDANAVNTSGTLSGSGGDGGLTFALTTAGAPTGFTYSLQPNGNLWVMQGSNHVLTVTVNSATGAYTVSQVAPIDHSGLAGADENNAIFDISYTVKDSDGDTVTGHLSVNVDDDTPTAHDDSGTQAIGVPTVTVDVLANDARGADGVTDSHVAYVNGTLTGTGTLVYNNDGTFTYTPAAGEHGIVTFQYNITDGDGDLSKATVTITLTANSIPTVSVSGDQSVDEAGLPPHNGLPAGSVEQTDDGNPNNDSDHSETAAGSIDITTGTDTLASLVIDGVDVTSGGTVSGAGHYGTLTVTHNPDGTYSYSYTLADNTSGDATEDDFHVVVTDNNGDPASTTLAISIADDHPTAFDDVANQTVQNQPITIDVVANDVLGADGVTSSNVAYVNGSLTGTGALVYNNNGTFTYTPSAGESGTVTFQYTITDADGDPSTAIVTLSLTPDTIPSVGGATNVSVDEDNLPNANSDNGQANPTEADHNDPAAAIGTVNVDFGADDITAGLDVIHAIEFINPGALDGQLTQNGAPVTFAYGSDHQHLVGSVNGSAVITIAFSSFGYGPFGGPVTYGYTATLSGPVDQAFGDQLEDGLTLTGVQFQVTDVDGSHAGGTFNVTIYDDVPSVSVTTNADAAIVLETHDAATIGAASDSDSTSFSGAFNLSFDRGADGANTPALSYTLGATDGTDSGLTQDGAKVYLYRLTDGSVVGSTATSEGAVIAANTVFSVTVNGTSGSVSLTQFSQIDHTDESPNSGSPYDDQSVHLADGAITLTASATITDKDGDTATSSQTIGIGANIHFADDGPNGAGSGTALGQAILDETRPIGSDTSGASTPDGLDTKTIDLSAAFVTSGSVDYGADGAGSVKYVLTLNGGPNVGSGLYVLDLSDKSASDGDGYGKGSEIVLNVNAAGDTITGTVGITPIFTITIDPNTGIATFTQYQNIWNPSAGSTGAAYDDVAVLSTSLASMLQVTQIVTDYDHDTSATSVDIGQGVFGIQDDGPALGTIQPLTANDNPAQTPAVGSLHLAIGTDGFSAVTINPNLSGLSSGGHALIGEQVGNVYTAYADVNGDHSIDAGDGAVFTISVDPNGGTSGTYTFDLLQPLDQTATPFDIGDGSSFGVGPSQSVVVTDDATGTNLVFVTGWAPNAGFDNAAWLAGGNPSVTQTSNVNGSSAGWGLGNDNFDSGEFMRFDFGALNDYDGGGGYTAPGSPTIATVSYATFSFFGFGSGDTIEFVAHYENGTTQNFILSDGSQSTLTITAPSGTNIAWIDVYESDGKIKMNLDQVGVITHSIDETIPVTMTFTDGDGDSITGSTTIHVTDGAAATTPNAIVHQASVTTMSLATTSLVSSSDNAQSSDSRVAGQSAVLMGALAAVGLEAAEGGHDAHGDSQAAAVQPLAMPAHTVMAAAAPTAASDSSAATDGLMSVHRTAEAEISHGLSHAADVSDQPHALARGESHQSGEVNALLHESAPAAPTHGHGTAVTAAGIAMPSAQQLAAAGAAHGQPDASATAGVQHNAVVGKVLADSLNGGEGHGPHIDSLLNAHGGHAGGLNVVHALADAAAAPLHFGHVGFTTVMGGHHMEIMHHDAAPPAHA